MCVVGESSRLLGDTWPACLSAMSKSLRQMHLNTRDMGSDSIWSMHEKASLGVSVVPLRRHKLLFSETHKNIYFNQHWLRKLANDFSDWISLNIAPSKRTNREQNLLYLSYYVQAANADAFSSVI